MRLLLLEDDAETARTLGEGLRARGYEVAHASDVGSAAQLLADESFDAAILDLMVPGGSGLDVLGEIRRSGHGTPVLILTARDALEDRVSGLERGADDYLVKPFAFGELLARLRALLRRPAGRVELLRVDPLEIDPLHRRVSVGERLVDLTRTEFDLLLRLAERRGEILSRRLLLQLVWGYRFDPGTNVVDVHVNRLRRKLETAGVRGALRTVRGIGYVVD
jgi:DNA-binding response OmpR family regulator